ncbi:hypothetical protein FFF34_001130 [Inquilinus sp. KBS0705]|nr:hypothetical protein FFF34_001130 [Inquilinus sp. KBS0705]
MEEKYKQKYRVQSARLTGWDYGSHALYFVTICTKDRVPYFGEIKSGIESQALLEKTPVADIAYHNWMQIPIYHPYVELDEFVIMPDHVHGVLFINKPDKTTWEINKAGPQSKDLASIIRGYKSSVKQYTMLNGIDFSWQSSYYDRVIRNEKELANVRTYINNNTDNWLLNGGDSDNFYR